MNPTTWTRHQQIALALTILLGVVLGITVGYVVYASGRGAGGALSFSYWLELSFRFRRAGIWWGLTGGGVASALFYIRLLLSR